METNLCLKENLSYVVDIEMNKYELISPFLNSLVCSCYTLLSLKSTFGVEFV